MADPTRPNSFADGQVIDALRMNQDFDAIYDWAKNQAMHKDGTKPFTALPSGPGGGAVPVSDAQLANKLYVDNAIAGLDPSGTGGTGTAWTSSNDGSGSGLDADLLDGAQGSAYARKDVSVETFNGRIGVAGGSTGGPGVYFNVAPTTGIMYNNGLGMVVGGYEVIGLSNNGAINLNKAVKAYSLVTSSKGGTPVYHNSGDKDIYAYTSSIKTKENVRRPGGEGDTSTEYVSKMLATELPTWDAQIVTTHEDGVKTKRPAGVRGKKQDRGTAIDRLGPIIEDMEKTWPEAVLYDDEDAPVSLDESLITATLWAAVKGLVQTLKDTDVLHKAWPQSA